MARILREDFATPVKWLGEASDNNTQNAAFSKAILAQENVTHILLVTDNMHMSRAKMIFKQSSLNVVAAPTVFFSHSRLLVLDFFPNSEGLRRIYYALDEWIGICLVKIALLTLVQHISLHIYKQLSCYIFLPEA